MLELDRGLGDDLVGGEDRGAGADGEGEGVGRPRVDLQIAPRSAPGRSFQTGRRSQAVRTMAPQTATPRNGKELDTSPKRVLTTTLTAIAASRMKATMKTRAQSTRASLRSSLAIGE